MSDTDDPGMGEKLKGTAKEAAGKATGNEDLEREGEAQQKGHEGEQTKHQD